MARDDEKLLRQLSLVSFLLGRGRPATSAEIRDSVEGYALMSGQAFTRRFYGDREELRQLGIAIEASTDESGAQDTQSYYLPEENYYLPELFLTEAETRSLSVALGLLEGRFAYARPLRLALAALTQGEPNPREEELERASVSLAPDNEAHELGKRLARLEDAVSRRKTVLFAYLPSHSDTPGERRLDPYGLFRIGGHWYVVGRDHDRGRERTFRVGRMAGTPRYATKNPRDFEVPAHFDAERSQVRPPWLLGEPQGDAVFSVCDDLAWWVSRSFPGLRALGSEAGWTTFGTRYADPDALLSWILGLGKQARLLSPPELVQGLLKDLERVRHAHEDRPGVGK
jgi:proteasome accessory factor C